MKYDESKWKFFDTSFSSLAGLFTVNEGRFSVLLHVRSFIFYRNGMEVNGSGKVINCLSFLCEASIYLGIGCR